MEKLINSREKRVLEWSPENCSMVMIMKKGGGRMGGIVNVGYVLKKQELLFKGC